MSSVRSTDSSKWTSRQGSWKRSVDDRRFLKTSRRRVLRDKSIRVKSRTTSSKRKNSAWPRLRSKSRSNWSRMPICQRVSVPHCRKSSKYSKPGSRVNLMRRS